MNAWRSLLFYWRSQSIVLVGIAIACAVLIGSLAVGDSAQQSMDYMRAKRLGQIDQAIIMQGRFIHDGFAKRLSEKTQVELTAVLTLRGLVSNPSKQIKHPRILVHGVSDSFWSFAPKVNKEKSEDGLAINSALAKYLQVEQGDELVLRLEQPSLLSRDAPLTPDDDALVATRLSIANIVDDQSFGAFQLSSSLEGTMNVFLPLSQLQDLTEMKPWVNQIFTKEINDIAAFERAMSEEWRLQDVGIDIVKTTSGSELRSQRIFIDRFIGDHVAESASGVLGYMVNRFEAGDRKTPYSIIAGLDKPLFAEDPLQQPSALNDNEIIINQWLADDLQVKAQDEVNISYYELQQNNDLVERQRTFIVRDICSIRGLAADRSLMPPFPGLADKDDCREWDPGSHVELDDIRDKDEAYWDAYRGTPKAFVSYVAAQDMWANRFGNATAFRSSLSPEQLSNELRQKLHAEDFGIVLTPIKELSEKASAGGARYITSVFVSLNMFLVIAAFILITLFYSMFIEQRRRESGVLFSLGFTWPHITLRLFKEQCVLLIIGLLFGCLGAYVFFTLFSNQLSSTWSDAIAGAQLSGSIAPLSFIIGSVATAAIVLGVCWYLLRRFRQVASADLLRLSSEKIVKSPMRLIVVAGICFIMAIAALLWLPLAPNDPIRFFVAALLILLSGLCVLAALFRHLDSEHGPLNQKRLIALNMSRQGRRHLLLIAMLAGCVFLIVASSAFKMEPGSISYQRTDGTGGFHLFGEVSLAVEKNINTKPGQDLYALDVESLHSAHVVHMRSNNDDEASCLNLNQSETPRLWGLDWSYLNQQQAFPFMQSYACTQSPWELLKEKREGRIPVIGDVNSLLWNLGKGLGSVLTYATASGETYELEIVGLLQDTMLQGGLLMDEQYFTEMFPHVHGYRFLMVDTNGQQTDAVAQHLSNGLQQLGLVLEDSAQRLDRYNAVRNTYIVIFQIIGALGVALASVGLAAIVLRQILERRQEFALLRALGYSSTSLKRMIFLEHAWIVVLSLGIGIVAALVAILPLHNGVDSVLGALIPLVLIAIVALFSAWCACQVAMRGSLLEGLRSE